MASVRQNLTRQVGEQPTPRSNWRESAFAALTGEPLQVLVVGGGIVGAGIARDAAMRGLRVGLVEQHDFAFGTSSRSSRLLHGGMRYLAQGRLGLVREASIEKKIIQRIAPHLAEPLPFIFPAYRGNRDWVLWQLKLGVKIYDWLCGTGNFAKSSWLGPRQALEKVPALQARELKGAVRYYDGFTNDARLVLDTLRSAAWAGAVVLNYCRFDEGRRKELWHCHLSDQAGDYTLEVRAHCIVNATGPWADRLPHSHVRLRLTKGIHIVVERERVPVTETVVMTEGKRILFAIPWGERTILGTTDTDYNGSRDVITATRVDLEYLLKIANHFFPTTNLKTSDVISGWAGLRPLLADPNGRPSDISRSHQIRNPEPGWWDVAGGKLTTYRLMAEQTVDKILKSLNGSDCVRGALAPCRTADEVLLAPEETMGISGILPPAFKRSAVEHYCTKEWVVHLDDIMVRRTSWQRYFRDAANMADQVADWMAEMFNWSQAERAHEIERYFESTRCDWSAPVSRELVGTHDLSG